VLGTGYGSKDMVLQTQRIHDFKTPVNGNSEVQKAVVRESHVTEEKLKVLLGQTL